MFHFSLNFINFVFCHYFFICLLIFQNCTNFKNLSSCQSQHLSFSFMFQFLSDIYNILNYNILKYNIKYFISFSFISVINIFFK